MPAGAAPRASALATSPCAFTAPLPLPGRAPMIPSPTLGPLPADGEEAQMATRNRRNEWHQVNEKWTRSLGERGMRVRLFQKRRDGTFYRTVWIPGRGRDHASMMTKDRGEAERLGRLLLAELLRQEDLTLPGRLTLGALWDRYRRECAAFLDNKADSRRDDEGRARVLLAFFGERCEVRTLTAGDQATYSARRRAKMELALVLAEATGRRLGSIRQLRWEDIDVARSTIRWRAEADKKGREWVVPCPASLVEELKQFRKTVGAIGGWLFACERKPEQPMDRHLFDKWLRVAEERAKLLKLVGGLWHPYRRKWATEQKHHSLKDVAAAGGWKDTETLLTCYQQPDTETLLAVMSEQRKVRDAALASPNR